MTFPGTLTIDASTRCCGVYGHPVRHSASPAMQNAGLAALGLNWRYLAFEVDPAHLAEALAGARAMRFVGLNLTVPHKLLAHELVDCLDETARDWGAVNTIRFEAKDASGRWRSVAEFEETTPEPVRMCGFNTDADAIVRSLREDLGWQSSGASVLLLGTGGAGRVAALRLAAEGIGRIHLVNRSSAKADAVAAEIRQRYPNVAVAMGYPKDEVDLVLNATSLGLREADTLPMDLGRFPLRNSRCVYDMIYRPAETPFLRAAREAGCRAANGMGMLLYQGARALEIWTDQPAPIQAMKEALHQHLYER